MRFFNTKGPVNCTDHDYLLSLDKTLVANRTVQRADNHRQGDPTLID